MMTSDTEGVMSQVNLRDHVVRVFPGDGPESMEVRPDSIKLTGRAQQLVIEAEGMAWTYDSILVTIKPGSAPSEEIADVLADLSVIYRKMGGSGIAFESVKEAEL